MAPQHPSRAYPRVNDLHQGIGYNPKEVFTAKKRAEYLEAFAKCGSVYKAALAIGVNPNLVWEGRRRNEEFNKLFEEARERIVDTLEAEAFRRGVQGIDKGVYYMGEMVSVETVYSDKLLVTLLRANAPDKYRYRDTLEDDDPRLDPRQVTVNISTIPSGMMIPADKVIDGTIAAPETARDNSILGNVDLHTSPGTVPEVEEANLPPTDGFPSPPGEAESK